MWCWRRLQKIIGTDHVKNEEVLYRVKEDRNVILTIKGKTDNWIGYMLRWNYFLNLFIDGKMKER